MSILLEGVRKGANNKTISTYSKERQSLKSKKLPRSSIFQQRLLVKVLSDPALQTGLQSWLFDKLFTVCMYGYLQGVPGAEPLSC